MLLHSADCLPSTSGPGSSQLCILQAEALTLDNLVPHELTFWSGTLGNALLHSLALPTSQLCPQFVDSRPNSVLVPKESLIWQQMVWTAVTLLLLLERRALLFYWLLKSAKLVRLVHFLLFPVFQIVSLRCDHVFLKSMPDVTSSFAHDEGIGYWREHPARLGPGLQVLNPDPDPVWPINLIFRPESEA